MNLVPNFYSLDKKIIFIVEDNEVYAKSLQTFINTRFPGIEEIKIFRVGEMCLAELENNPGLVIMDYFLNSVYEAASNGLEIIKQIKELKPQTKIIALSSQDKFSVVQEIIKEYGGYYVQKDEDAFIKVEQLIKEIFFF